VGDNSFGGGGGSDGAAAAAAAVAATAAAVEAVAAAAVATATAAVAKALAKAAKIRRYRNSLQSSPGLYSLLLPLLLPLPSVEVSNVIGRYLMLRKNKARVDLTLCQLSILRTRLSNAKRLAMLALLEEIRRNPTHALMAAIWPAMVSAIVLQDGGGGGQGGGEGVGGEDGLSTSTTTTMTMLLTAVVVDGGVVGRGQSKDDNVRPPAVGGGGDNSGTMAKMVEVDKAVQ
jgi:hypothetical protein